MTTHPYIQGRLAALHAAEIQKQTAAVRVSLQRRTIRTVVDDLVHGRLRRVVPSPCCHAHTGATRP